MTQVSSSAATLAAAIVLAGALVGAGLYLGLRHRDAAPPAAAVAAPTEPPAAAPPTADPEAAHAAALAALAARKPALAATCWQPVAASEAAPAEVRYLLDVTFDADGQQRSLGVQEDRAFHHPAVAACLREQPLALRIPPPGAMTQLSLPLRFP